MYARFRAAAYGVGGALVCTSFVATAFAQDAGSLLREQQRQEQQRTPQRLPDPDRPTAPTIAPPAADGEETVVVRTVRFTGRIDLLPKTERERITAFVTGQRLGIAGLRALAAEATAVLQREGRVLARAILPPQDVTDGTIVIEIIDGAIEQIEFNRDPDARVNEQHLRDVLGAHVDSTAIAKDDLEEGLLHINDHPGVTARARLTPGAAPDTSRLIVDVAQAPRLGAHVFANNHGSTATGREQGGAVLALTDLSGYGDLTRITGVVSEGQQYGSIASSLPLGASGVVASFDYGYLDYRNLDSVGRMLGIKGHAHYVAGGLDYAVLRSRQANVRIGADVEWKALTDDSDMGKLQDKRVRTYTLRVSGDVRDLLIDQSAIDWSLGWTFGDLDMSRVPGARAADRAGLRTHGPFQRLDANLAHLQNLPGKFSFYGSMRAQWASRNLDSSEEFTLGGPYGVRGWPVGEARGDMGVLGTLELRYDTPAPDGWGSLQWAAFLEGGRIRINKDSNGIEPLNACACNDYGLAGTGVALRWSAERFHLTATYAHGLGNNPGRSALTGENVDGKDRRNQFWLHAVARF